MSLAHRRRIFESGRARRRPYRLIVQPAINTPQVRAWVAGVEKRINRPDIIRGVENRVTQKLLHGFLWGDANPTPKSGDPGTGIPCPNFRA